MQSVNRPVVDLGLLDSSNVMVQICRLAIFVLVAGQMQIQGSLGISHDMQTVCSTRMAVT